jgi:hypothetical protein
MCLEKNLHNFALESAKFQAGRVAQVVIASTQRAWGPEFEHNHHPKKIVINEMVNFDNNDSSHFY